MYKNLATIVLVCCLATACSGVNSASVAPLQKKDKVLSCKEIMLEQNEAAFYRKTAEKNKGPSFKNVMMPLGYISTYVEAEKAIEASDSRIEYLNRIYDILDCDNPAAEANNRGMINTSGGYGRTPYTGGPQAASYNNHTYGGGYGSGTYEDNWYW